MILNEQTHIWLSVNLGESWELNRLENNLVEFLIRNQKEKSAY